MPFFTKELQQADPFFRAGMAFSSKRRSERLWAEAGGTLRSPKGRFHGEEVLPVTLRSTKGKSSTTPDSCLWEEQV